MQKLALKEVHAHLKDIPNGELFFVYADSLLPMSSSIIGTRPAGKVQAWTLAMRLGEQLYTGSWWTKETATKPLLNAAMRQLMNIKISGWYRTEEQRLDDEIHMFREPIYRCAYCHADTTNPVGKCLCRAIADGLKKTANRGT